MRYYQVAGKWNFTNYGKALSYARIIGKPVIEKKTYNIFKIIFTTI